MTDFRLLRLGTKGVIGSAICLLPLLSTQWSQVIAQQYEFDELIRLGELGANAAASGQAIVETCPTGANGESENVGNQRFQDDCDLIVGGLFGDAEGATSAFNSLAADQVSAQNSVSVRRNDTNISVVGHRMELLRVASHSSTYSPDESIAKNLLFSDALGGGASADNEFGRLGLFFNGRFATGDEDSDKYQDGFDFDVWDLMGGADYRFTDNFIAGVALTYAEGDIDYDKSRGSLDTDAWGALAYATYFLDDGLFFEGLLGYTGLDYSMEREVFYSVGTSSANQTMKSSPDGDLYSVSVGAGKSYNRESWSFTPSLRFDYLENDVDSYRERSTNLQTTGGAMALAVGSVNYESFTSNLGIQLATARSTERGVFVPQIRVDWVHEFEDDEVGLNANYLNDINRTRFKITTTAPDSDYFDLTAGVSAQFPRGKSGFITYRTLLGYEGLTYNAIQIGFRIELD